MRQNFLSYIIPLAVYLALQVFLFDNMTLYGTAFCFVYVAFILFLPFNINPMLLITLAFAGGLITDLFYDSMGVNACAMVLIAFIRKPWTALITPPGGYEDQPSPSIRALGLNWFIYYIFPLVFIHHFFMFEVESGHLQLSW